MAGLDDAIAQVARETGLDPSLLRRTVQIESSGNPYASTGSYHGLMQLSNGEFNRYQPGGNIWDPVDNLRAGAAKMVNEMRGFSDKFGRDPTPTDYYLNHQQGTGGLAMHLQYPDRPAWQNMYMTAEGQQKGPDWARRAIWGNVPDQYKRQFGNVENLTSGDFYKMWQNRFEGTGGNMSAPSQPSYSDQDSPALVAPVKQNVASKITGPVAGVQYTGPSVGPSQVPQTGSGAGTVGEFGTGGLLGTEVPQGGGGDASTAALLQMMKQNEPQLPAPPAPGTLMPQQLRPPDPLQIPQPQLQNLSMSPLSIAIARAAAQRQQGGM